MKEFIIDLLCTLGLGVHGKIQSLQTDKTKEIFPNHEFVPRDTNNGVTYVDVWQRRDVLEDRLAFTLRYEHADNGFVTGIQICDS